MQNNIKKKLNEAPRGFCLAKWYQVTIDLSRGYTHSCHHPKRHKIPIDEIILNPSALHNTKFKKEQRKMMLSGNRPPECEYCWNIEDTSNHLLSDRYIKSSDEWAFDKFDQTLSLTGEEDITPTYLEVIFSSDCNLNCMYCMADISSSIEKEMKKFGPYPVVSNDHRMPIEEEIKEDNPYITAFWKWLPEIITKLKIFRITGGEPLLSSNTFKFLDYLEENPASDLDFAINTNLSYSSIQLEKFLAKCKVLIAKKAVKKVSFFTSLDSFSEQAEYIRKGLDTERFFSNIKLISEKLPDSEIIIMCTFNILSVAKFDQLLKHLHCLKQGQKITLDLSYLKEPQYLRANLIDESLLTKVEADLKLMKSLSLYSQYEIAKFERIYEWIKSTYQNSNEKQALYRSDFYSFINEYDKRFDSNFVKTFPEYERLYKICKKANLWQRHFSNSK